MWLFSGSMWSPNEHLLIGTWGRQEITSSLMMGGWLRTLWKYSTQHSSNFTLSVICVFPSTLERSWSWCDWTIDSLQYTIKLQSTTGAHQTSYSAMCPAFDAVSSIPFPWCCSMQPNLSWMQGHWEGLLWRWCFSSSSSQIWTSFSSDQFWCLWVMLHITSVAVA